MAKYEQYAEYKDSGIEWLGDIPESWKLGRISSFFHERRTKVSDKDYPALSVTKSGVFPQWEHVAKSNDGDNRKLVKKGDFVINSRSDRKGSSGTAKQDGSVSLINIVLQTKEIEPRYSEYLFKSNAFIEEFYRMGHGIVADLWTTRFDNIKNSLMPVPTCAEQTAIADFLDRKTIQLDQAIELKQQQIEKLNEYKQITIQNAVTKGLDANVKMKDSGVDLLGHIPEHWEAKRLKYVLTERNERTKTGDEPLFMVSQKHGLVVRADYHDKATVAFSNIDNKVVYENDLVFNKLKAHLGVFYKSEISFKGIVSPDYAVYKRKAYIDDLKFLEILFRHPSYIEQFIVRATGIVEGLIRLYTSELFDLHIPIPPSNEQKEILAFAEKITAQVESAKDVLQNKIDKLREYRTVLINDAVTGKIKVSEE